eukprot:CAMPEP_0172181642 /NCGR_PEP_ID=MMETSP1050-20130122/17936_1 /TAXON_ID=233186 /ORGANISM="Cryptomonas curvata, Strain CCAP979/52" /LENGTH=137 /DNA_ID=CAMNT_0012854957 /DNA_START=38 /DNA_END=450 /DNA_ORIENTATION=+
MPPQRSSRACGGTETATVERTLGVRRGVEAGQVLEQHRGALLRPTARAALARYVVGSSEDDDMAERVARGGGGAERCTQARPGAPTQVRALVGVDAAQHLPHCPARHPDVIDGDVEQCMQSKDIRVIRVASVSKSSS